MDENKNVMPSMPLEASSLLMIGQNISYWIMNGKLSLFMLFYKITVPVKMLLISQWSLQWYNIRVLLNQN